MTTDEQRKVILSLGVMSTLSLAIRHDSGFLEPTREPDVDPVLVDLGVAVAMPKPRQELRGRGPKFDVKPTFCRRCSGSTLVDRGHQDACRCLRPKGPGT